MSETGQEHEPGYIDDELHFSDGLLLGAAIVLFSVAISVWSMP